MSASNTPTSAYDPIRALKNAVSFHMDSFYQDHARVSQAVGDLERVRDELKDLLTSTGDPAGAEVWQFCEAQLVIGWRELVENPAFANTHQVNELLAEGNPVRMRELVLNMWAPILRLHYQLHCAMDVLTAAVLGLETDVRAVGQTEGQQMRAAAEVNAMLAQWTVMEQEVAAYLVGGLQGDPGLAQIRAEVLNAIDQQVALDFDPNVNFDTVIKKVKHLGIKSQKMESRLVSVTAKNYKEYQFHKDDVSKTFMLLVPAGDNAALIQSLRNLTIDRLELAIRPTLASTLSDLIVLGARHLHDLSPIQVSERLGLPPLDLSTPAGFISRAHLILNITDNGRLLDPRNAGAYRPDWVRPGPWEYPPDLTAPLADADIEARLEAFRLHETEDGWWAVTEEGARAGTLAVFTGRVERMASVIAQELCSRHRVMIDMITREQGYLVGLEDRIRQKRIEDKRYPEKGFVKATEWVKQYLAALTANSADLVNAAADIAGFGSFMY